MPKFHSVRPIGAKSSFAFAGLGLVALLSACGGQPAATNVEENAVENTAAVMNNMAAPAVTNETVAPNAAETPVAKAEETPVATPTPTPTPTPTKVAAAAAAPGGDAANGAKLFAQCKICHSVEPGKNGLGPSLHGIVGSKAAEVDGFAFSTAMKASGITWTDATLSDYLRAPMKKVPGTKMAFAGIADEAKRADIVAYLDTLK